MSIKDLNCKLLANLISTQLEHVTCSECCKYYSAAATSRCGHSLCRPCWAGRRSCPACSKSVDKKQIEVNEPLQSFADNVAKQARAFEKLFRVKIEEFVNEAENMDVDPKSNVQLWLASSQNHFSAPVTESQDSPRVAPIEISASNIQIHTNSKKVATPTKVLHVTPQQDDWDKIEEMPDTEDVVARDKENVIGPMDFEPFLLDDNEYTNDNPRRSSRKKDKHDSKEIDVNSKTSNADSEKKSTKAPQTWSNVKKMRKEFSKLNKKNRNKLNVSIEMAKKTQTSNNKTTVTPPVVSQPTYTIDDDTPDLIDDKHRNKEQDLKQLEKSSKDNDNDPKMNENKKDLITSRKEIDKIDEIDMDIDYDNFIEKVEDVKIIKSNSPKSNNKKTPSEKQLTQSASFQKNNKPGPIMPFIKKSSLYTQAVKPQIPVEQVQPTVNSVESVQNPVTTINTDDIEITIKIGNTITNIVINKKQNDVQLKVNTDREIQTSLGPQTLRPEQKSTSTSTDTAIKNLEINICGQSDAQTQVTVKNKKEEIAKSASTKKNTASAETGTAQFEITASVEREISNIMECVENADSDKTNVEKTKTEEKTKLIPQEPFVDDNEIQREEELMNEDIFASGSVNEQPVQMLSGSNSARSEVLLTKSRTQKDKRQRENDNEDVSQVKKKLKRITEKESQKEQKNVQDSESMNYDTVMDKVFASIDKDIEIIKSQSTIKNTQLAQKTQASSKKTTKSANSKDKTPIIVSSDTQMSGKSVKKTSKKIDENKYSENMFSMLEKDTEPPEGSHGSNKQVPGSETQRHLAALLTPRVCDELGDHNDDVIMADGVGDDDVTTAAGDGDEVVNTPAGAEDDHSVVEDTPQKNISIGKNSNKNINLLKPAALHAIPPIETNRNSQRTQSVINLTDSVDTKDNDTIVDKQRVTLETPLNINKFFDHITYKSTPMARKSLNFNQNTEDIDKTLCPSNSVMPKNTQEREFLSKAFENTPVNKVVTPVNKVLVTPVNKHSDVKCIAGSCLSGGELGKVRALCGKYGWRFVEKYSAEVTHLVVGVDENGGAQRSVKYMLSLAASKWIVTIQWVEHALRDRHASEREFEAVDMCGAPAPRLSRRAPRGLFRDITFYCMPPFSILDTNDLKTMITSAGGVVAGDIAVVRGTRAPALLLAEPEHTQEDKFIYLAMQQQVVPVNYEWVLNCLGEFRLLSIHPLLLCPAAVLHKLTEHWPQELMAEEYDEECGE